MKAKGRGSSSWQLHSASAGLPRCREGRVALVTDPSLPQFIRLYFEATGTPYFDAAREVGQECLAPYYDDTFEHSGEC